MIRKIFFLIDNNIKQGVNIERDRSLILSKYLSVIKEKSIVNKAPELLQNWDSDLNGSLNLEYITYMSSQKLHWKSHVCGYWWKASVSSRVTGNRCLACVGKVLVLGKNDLLSQNSPLAKEWDYSRNGNLRLESLTVYSGGKVWRKCSVCNTEWNTYISNGVRGYGCPICFKKIQADWSIRSSLKHNGSIKNSNLEILENGIMKKILK